MTWYLSIYQAKEIESSSFNYISHLSLSLSLSFCPMLCYIGGKFYFAPQDSQSNDLLFGNLHMNIESASQRSHIHQSWGFIPFPIVLIPSDSACHRVDQETQKTALLLLISLKPEARMNQTHMAGAMECKVPRLAFQSALTFPKKSWIRKSKEVSSRKQMKTQRVDVFKQLITLRYPSVRRKYIFSEGALLLVTTNESSLFLILPFKWEASHLYKLLL